MQDKSITFIIVIAILWAFWHYDFDPFGDEVSAYMQNYSCKDATTQKGCEWVNSRHTIYNVNENSQTVMYWSEENPWPLRKIIGCKVANKNHWSCDNHGFLIGFNNGDVASHQLNNTRNVSKTTWWINKL